MQAERTARPVIRLTLSTIFKMPFSIFRLLAIVLFTALSAVSAHADRIVIRYEYWNAVRNVYLDGREIPADIEPTRLGHSVGRFDDGVLIVETTNLVPSQISLIGNKFYLSEEARFVEHYRMSEDGMRLDIEWSVIDPVNLRGPYTSVMAWLRAPGWELDEWRCEAITGEF